MPRTRDNSMDDQARRLLRLAVNSPRQWLVFRLPGDYDARLTLQRAIFYLRTDKVSVQVEWADPVGRWARLLTPKGQEASGPRTLGSPVGRLKVNTKADGQAAARKAIEAGTAAYDTLS